MHRTAPAEVVGFKPRPRTGPPLSEAVREAVQRYLQTLGDQPVRGLYALLVEQMEKPLLEVALEHAAGNQSKAAAILGLSRATLRKKLRRHGLL